MRRTLPFDAMARCRSWFRAVALALLAASAPGLAAQDLLEARKAFRATAHAEGSGVVRVRFEVAPGYYLYRDKLKFTIEPGSVSPAADLPAGKMHEDEFFGRVETYRGQVDVRLTLPEPRPGQRIRVLADSQGCADVGVCYPPFRQDLDLALPQAAARRR